MTRTLLLAAHVVAVAAWLGANLLQLAIAPWINRRPAVTRADWADATGLLARWYYNPAGTIVAATGIALVVHEHRSFGSGFVIVGLTVVTIGGLLGLVVFSPTAGATSLAWRTGRENDALRHRARMLRYAAADTVLVVLAVVAMVDHWTA